MKQYTNTTRRQACVEYTENGIKKAKFLRRGETYVCANVVRVPEGVTESDVAGRKAEKPNKGQ